MSLNHYCADYELPKVLTDEVGDELDIRLIDWQVDEDRHLDAFCEASLTVSYHATPTARVGVISPTPCP